LNKSIKSRKSPAQQIQTAFLEMTNYITLLQNNRLLEKSLENGGEIQLQDAATVWYNMPSGALSSRVAFNYIRNKWSSIYEK
jgi:hypothetical protein